MRNILITTLFMCSAAASEAEHIAANAMRDRARTVSDPIMARALTDLAQAIDDGRTNLAEARDAVAVIAALPPASVASAAKSVEPTPQPRYRGKQEESVDAAGVTSLLDKDLASTPTEVEPDEEPVPLRPDRQKFEKIDGKIGDVYPADGERADTKPAVKGPRLDASVLAIRLGEDNRPRLIMINKGADKSVQNDQIVSIMHDGVAVVKCRVSEVKTTMSVCKVMAETLKSSVEIKEGDVAIVEGNGK
jgi:hypothetical protein